MWGQTAAMVTRGFRCTGRRLRATLLIKAEGHLAGFALVSRGSLLSGDRDVWDMAEFFVLKRYRRAGVGVKAAHEIWRRHPGRWEVRVLEANAPAQRFWQVAVDLFAGVAIQPVLVEQDGRPRRCYAFECVDPDAPSGAPSPTGESARG